MAINKNTCRDESIIVRGRNKGEKNERREGVDGQKTTYRSNILLDPLSASRRHPSEKEDSDESPRFGVECKEIGGRNNRYMDSESGVGASSVRGEERAQPRPHFVKDRPIIYLMYIGEGKRVGVPHLADVGDSSILKRRIEKSRSYDTCAVEWWQARINSRSRH